MAVSTCEDLISPAELKEQYPLNEKEGQFIAHSRQTIANILSGEDPRLLFIVGPCSIHDITSAKEYAIKLKALADRVEDRFYLVMRVYLEKPRTGLSWKGLIYDPFLNNTQNMPIGLATSRQLLLDLAALRMPAATEFLDMATVYYLNDLISWGCIGARTASSQLHRQIASGLSMPVGFKNNTDGNIQIAIEGVKVASVPHCYIGINGEGKASLLHTKGNAGCHIVLRGGQRAPNYDPESIAFTLNLLKEAGCPPSVLVDCAHDNSFKNHDRQVDVFHSLIEQYHNGNHCIRGILLESHLFEGKQSHNAKNLRYGVSITDACLDWERTENLMQWAYDRCKIEKGNELILR